MPDPATCPHVNILADFRPGVVTFAVCRDCGATLTPHVRRLRLVPPPPTAPEEATGG